MVPIVVAITVSFAVVGFITYYLFFSPVPKIDDFLTSPELKEKLDDINDISTIDFDVPQIESSATYQELSSGSYIGEPETEGKSGRPDPFKPF